MQSQRATSPSAMFGNFAIPRSRGIFVLIAIASIVASIACSGSGGGGGTNPVQSSGGRTPNGDVYVSASGLSTGIAHFDAASGNILGTFASGISPEGPTIGPDGNLYVIAKSLLLVSIVLRYDRMGNFIDCFVPQAQSLQTCLSLAPNLGNIVAGFFHDLTFGPDGNLYVTADNALLIFNGTSGAFVGYASTSGVFIRHGLASDNNLYLVTASPFPSIERFNVTNGQLTTLVTNFTGVPIGSGLTIGPDGNLYVINNQDLPGPGGGTVTLAQVDRYDLNGNFIGTFVNQNSGGLGDASNLVFGNDGNLYILDASGNNHILCYDGATGNFLRLFSTVPSSVGSLPGYITF